MITEEDLSILVSNIVSENRYSNCRLCLKEIQEHYIRFDDAVALDPMNTSFQPLSNVLSQILGLEVCEDIPGIDAVCSDCVCKVLEVSRFLEMCQNSTNLLNKVLNNLTEALSFDINENNKSQTLYLIVGENESKVVLMNNPQKRRNNSHITKQKQFECYECYEVFDNVMDLKDHHLNCHGTLTCERCCETFLSETELNFHLSSKHKYECPECHQHKSTEEALKEHQDRVHNIYVCKDCGKSFRGLDKLQIHEEKHSSKNECPSCGKTYNTKEFFLKHVKLCLQGLLDPHPIRSNIKKPFSCEKCGKSYSTKGGLRVHNRFVHGNAKPHVCKHCDKKFTAPSYLKVHMIKHTGEKNFKCDLCGNRFVSKEALLYHTRRHTGEKPYSCKLCNEKFVNASSRAEHVKFKHVGPTLMCEICSRKFVTSHFLKQHMSRHHDPTSKLYCGRNMIPPNMPGEQNMRRFKVENED